MQNNDNPTGLGDTEPYPSGEFAQMLVDRAIQAPGQAVLSQPKVSPSSSATNSFTSTELHRMHQERRAGAAASADDSPAQASQQKDLRALHPNVRIFLERSHAVSVKVTPYGNTDAAAEAASRPLCFVLDAGQPETAAVQKLAVTQSKKDLGITIQAAASSPRPAGGQTATPAALLLDCTLYFDPVNHGIAMLNRGFRPVTARMVAAVGDPAQATRSIDLKPFLP
ncbi:hypothetical protein VTK56DRAFT_9676 [Thermocarpiscus australiensis]